jgi:hypothetical protein
MVNNLLTNWHRAAVLARHFDNGVACQASRKPAWAVYHNALLEIIGAAPDATRRENTNHWRAITRLGCGCSGSAYRTADDRTRLNQHHLAKPTMNRDDVLVCFLLLGLSPSAVRRSGRYFRLRTSFSASRFSVAHWAGSRSSRSVLVNVLRRFKCPQKA